MSTKRFYRSINSSLEIENIITLKNTENAIIAILFRKVYYRFFKPVILLFFSNAYVYLNYYLRLF